MSGDFSITTKNDSLSPFKLAYTKHPDNDAIYTVISEPADTLPGGSGTETLSWAQALSTITSGDADTIVGWRSPNGRTFGVRIWAPYQFGPFGTRPYYQTKTDDHDWDGEHHGDGYTFPKDIGYSIVIKSTSGSGTMHLLVTITDI